MLGFLKNIFQDLIPHQDLPNGVWLSRYFTLFLSSTGLILLIYFLIKDTNLGQKYGLTSLQRRAILTHVSFTNLSRNIKLDMRRLVSRYPSVNSVFLITQYDPETEMFTIKPRETDIPIVWEWVSPDSLDLQGTLITPSISNLEYLSRIEQSNPLNVKSKNQCIHEPLTQQQINSIRQELNIKGINGLLICPVHYGKNLANTLGRIVIFYTKDKLEDNDHSIKELTSTVRELSFKISRDYAQFNTYIREIQPLILF